MKNCPYQTAIKQEKRFSYIAFIEPALLFIAIIAVTLLLGTMQMRDEQAKQSDFKKEHQAKCQWHQPSHITEFDCTVINERLAVIK